MLESDMESVATGARYSLVSIFTSIMSDKEKFRRGSPSMPGLLENIRDNGFSPVTIIDIGANVGDWHPHGCVSLPLLANSDVRCKS